MHPTLMARRGTLVRKVAEHPGVQIWVVAVDNVEAEAVVYPDLIGDVVPGDQVLCNTTAVELNLGTGGQHFVITRMELGGPVPPPIMREEGHIIKLRYTPLQCRVLAVEEEASPYHEAMWQADRLPGTPVVCLGLHSQLAPVAAAVKAADPTLRTAFVMTDSAALPLAYSNIIEQLKQAGLLDVTITAGQAFGGDLEAVNPYSAMLAAVVAACADVIICGQGPGNVGTATPLGFGGIEQAMLLNAAGVLGGVPIAAPRISFADPRDRHRGISHHSVTVLGRLTLVECVLALPLLPAETTSLLLAQIERDGLGRHCARAADGEAGIRRCQELGIALSSMGRRYEQDPVFFLAAAAAGRLAAEMQSEK